MGASGARYHPPMPVAALTTPDMIVLVVCLLLAVRGTFKGFAWQAVRTVGLWAAIVIAGWQNERVGAWLNDNIGFLPSAWKEEAGWFLILVVVWILAVIISYMARGAMRNASLTGTDRCLGFAMGAVMGVALCTIVFVIWGKWVGEDELRQTLESSFSVRYLAVFVDVVNPIIPDAVHERVTTMLQAIRAASEG